MDQSIHSGPESGNDLLLPGNDPIFHEHAPIADDRVHTIPVGTVNDIG
jgi:hypothetical protein